MGNGPLPVGEVWGGGYHPQKFVGSFAHEILQFGFTQGMLGLQSSL